MKEIVSSEWLNQQLSNPNLVILDASMESVTSGQELEKSGRTIPSARRVNLKKVFLDKDSTFPNTIPNPQEFESEARKLGINQESEIVVYDTKGVYSSPRLWWLFKVMGHKNISVLDGGLPDWINHGFPTEEKHAEIFELGDFKVNFDRSSVVDFKQVTDNIQKRNFLIVDARSEDRFTGMGKEPRKHLKSGKIDNSVNIPFKEVLVDGKYKSAHELKELFEDRCQGEKNLVFSCGSGITACIIMLASQMSYSESQKVYDGSWTEWAERNKLTYDV